MASKVKAKKTRLNAGIFAIALIILSAIIPGGQTATTNQKQLATYEDLYSALAQQGLAVEYDGSVRQPFFSITGDIFRANGQELQVFLYPDEMSAAFEASGITPDGSGTASIKVTWTGKPHFYMSGAMVLLYVGGDAKILSALDAIFGRQFAGK